MQKNSVVRLEHSQVCQTQSTIMTLKLDFKIWSFWSLRLGWDGLFTHLFVQSNVQPYIWSRICSFINVSEKNAKYEKGKVLQAEESWFEYNPSSPSITPFVDENINFIPNLRS
jgi:hypothetical protein